MLCSHVKKPYLPFDCSSHCAVKAMLPKGTSWWNDLKKRHYQVETDMYLVCLVCIRGLMDQRLEKGDELWARENVPEEPREVYDGRVIEDYESKGTPVENFAECWSLLGFAEEEEEDDADIGNVEDEDIQEEDT